VTASNTTHASSPAVIGSPDILSDTFDTVWINRN